MADGASPPEAVDQGIEVLRRCLGDAAELLRPVDRRPKEAAAFELPLPEDFEGKCRRLRISFGANFPVGELRFEVMPSAWLAWPHAMPRTLCLYGVGQRPPNASPEVIVGDAIERLRSVLRLVVAGSDERARREAFDEEITTYWDAQLGSCDHQLVMDNVPLGSGPLYGLYAPRDGFFQDGRVRLSGSKLGLAAMSPPLGRRERISRKGGVRDPAPVAFFLRLLGMPPVAMPVADALLAWLTPYLATEDDAALQRWLRDSAGFPNRWLVLQLPTDGAPKLVAWALSGGSNRRAPGMSYGQRANRRRAFRANQTRMKPRVWSANVQLVDARIVHARDPLSRADELAQRHVLMVGAGSLGSALAAKLLRSGVGRITLVDHDVLEDANLGRHELGANDVGRKKVVALAERFSRDFPASRIVPLDMTFEEALLTRPKLLDQVDAVVTTAGAWFPESLLWELKSRGASWSAIQAWSEPHAAVGHVLIAPRGSHDARRLFDSRGNFVEPWSTWPDEGIVPLPACGAGFVPGGPLGIGDIATLACRVTIEALAGAQNPNWHVIAGELDAIARAGGTYRGRPLPEGTTQGTWRLPWPTVPSSP